MPGPPSILTQWAAGDLRDGFISIYSLYPSLSSPKPAHQITLTNMCFAIAVLKSNLSFFRSKLSSCLYHTRCLAMKSKSFLRLASRLFIEYIS